MYMIIVSLQEWLNILSYSEYISPCQCHYTIYKPYGVAIRAVIKIYDVMLSGNVEHNKIR